MRLTGKCHCGNIGFEVDWPDASPRIPARACGCSFCVKHGGVWTSHPKAALRVRVQDAALASTYEFATRTATFHICGRCGVVTVVTSSIDGRTYAVVSVNALENVDAGQLDRGGANFEGEAVDSRLARRERNWIGAVQFDGPPARAG